MNVKNFSNLFFGHVVLLIFIGGCVGKVTVGPFSGIMGGPEGGWFHRIQLINETPSNMWVNVVFNIDDEKGVCEETVKLAGNKGHVFECPQESLVANVDYQFVVSVYSDEKLINLVNRFGPKMRLSDGQLKALLRTQKKIRKK